MRLTGRSGIVGPRRRAGWAAGDGDPSDAAIGSAIRQAGWDQVPWAAGDQWPPDDEIITISLSRDHWDFILAELDKSQRIYEELGEPKEIALGRAARSEVAAQLGRSE